MEQYNSPLLSASANYRSPHNSPTDRTWNHSSLHNVTVLFCPMPLETTSTVPLFKGSHPAPACPSGKRSVKTKMSVVHCWNDTDGGSRRTGRKTRSSANCSTTNLVCTGLESNSGFCGERQATNHIAVEAWYYGLRFSSNLTENSPFVTQTHQLTPYKENNHCLLREWCKQNMQPSIVRCETHGQDSDAPEDSGLLACVALSLGE
jgi:hypothetical protein